MLELWKIVENKVSSLHNETQYLDVSQTLVDMLIAAENHRFYRHSGVDPIAILRATIRTLVFNRREGGSTIAMQLVRVLTGRYEKTTLRKLVEIMLAIRLTRHVGKSAIPKLYIAVAYYGWRMNGVSEASKRLKLNCADITPLSAAQLIARLKYPEPKRADESRLLRIDKRASYILARSKKLFAIYNQEIILIGKCDGSL